MARRVIIFATAVVLLLLGLGPVRQAHTTQNIAKTQKTEVEEVADGRPIMWEEPVDLELRDLFFGHERCDSVAVLEAR